MNNSAFRINFSGETVQQSEKEKAEGNSSKLDEIGDLPDYVLDRLKNTQS